jgi:hypothetical protein
MLSMRLTGFSPKKKHMRKVVQLKTTTKNYSPKQPNLIGEKCKTHEVDIPKA